MNLTNGYTSFAYAILIPRRYEQKNQTNKQINNNNNNNNQNPHKHKVTWTKKNLNLI